MGAPPPICWTHCSSDHQVRYGAKADIVERPSDVRFSPRWIKSGLSSSGPKSVIRRSRAEAWHCSFAATFPPEGKSSPMALRSRSEFVCEAAASDFPSVAQMLTIFNYHHRCESIHVNRFISLVGRKY
jgi:hypothetical protein